MGLFCEMVVKKHMVFEKKLLHLFCSYSSRLLLALKTTLARSNTLLLPIQKVTKVSALRWARAWYACCNDGEKIVAQHFKIATMTLFQGWGNKLALELILEKFSLIKINSILVISWFEGYDKWFVHIIIPIISYNELSWKLESQKSVQKQHWNCR